MSFSSQSKVNLNRVSLFFILLLICFTFFTSPIYAFQQTGQSWSLVGFNNYYIHAFSVDPTNSSIIYIGTAHNGIFKSTDGGTTWNPSNSGLTDASTAGDPYTLSSLNFWSLLVDPTDSNNVYAGSFGTNPPAGQPGVWKSTNGGSNWVNISAGPIPFASVTDMAFDSNTHTLYESNYSHCGGVWKTSDGGTTWTSIGPSCDIYGLALDQIHSYIYAVGGGVWKSFDGGTTWSGVGGSTFGIGPTGRVSGIAIDPNNSNILYAVIDGGSHDGIYKSTDGSQSWTYLSSNPSGSSDVGHPLVTDPKNSNTLYAGGSNGVYMSTDGGITWTPLNSGFPNVSVTSLMIPTSNPTTLYAETTSGLYAYNLFSNNPPVLNQIANSTINEGGTYSENSSFTDSDSSSWTATVNYGDGSGPQPLTLSGTNFSLSHQFKDEGVYTVTVNVTDNQGATGTGTATVTVNNAPFNVGTITVPTPVVQVNSSVSASASYTDPGILDTHTANWNWGDGSSSTGTVTESNGSGSISDSHTYTTTGVYTVTLTVTDDDGLSSSSTYQYVSVYDPTAQGLFSAGQHFTSPTGAYLQNPSLTGIVKFGLSYKYQGTVPIGDKEFTMNFTAANLTFNATSVSSLVLSNSMATLTGTGTIDGSGNYNFLVTGVDGGGIRVQITDPSNNNIVIYDTQPGAPVTATPTTSVTGHVVVHN